MRIPLRKVKTIQQEKHELSYRFLDIHHFQNISFPGCGEILVVNDASEDVGSGGSALNALIRTAECLCYRKNYTVLTDAVLQNVNVLIVLVVSDESKFRHR